MTEKPNAPAAETADSGADLRGQLIRRLSVAAIIVALLLGILTIFDYLSQAPEEDEVPVFTQPVPVAPKKPATQPVTPVDAVPEPPAEDKPASAGEASTAQPVADTPPPPDVPAQPAAPENAASREPAHAQGGAKPVSRPQAVVRPATPARPEIAAVPESTAAPQVQPTPSPVPQPQPTAVPPAPARVLSREPSAGASRLFSGFVLQAGVFRSVQRAEELHAQLTLSGVPSTVETRVQVGPFKTRQEAEAAQQKLRELGIDTILVPPAGKR